MQKFKGELLMLITAVMWEAGLSEWQKALNIGLYFN